MRKTLCIVVALASLTTICTAQTITETFGSGANAFTMDFVTIGNANNSANTLNNPHGLAGSQLNAQAGSVGYTYAIAKYEVSRDIITKANAQSSSENILTDWNNYPGVGLPGISPSTMNGLNRPASGITWFGAARFVNWLNLSQGFSPAYKISFSPPTDGAIDSMQIWQPTDVGYDRSNLFRNSQARYFLPSLDEWHKAAYYNPSTGSYSLYATGSNSLPISTTGGTTQGTAIYNTAIFGYDGVTADVDNAGGLSPYGTIGMSGNVFEWVETAKDLVNSDGDERRLFVGGYYRTTQGLRNDELLESEPFGESPNLGFRIAMIPEPSSISLLLIGVAGVASRRLLKRRS